MDSTLKDYLEQFKEHVSAIPLDGGNLEAIAYFRKVSDMAGVIQMYILTHQLMLPGQLAIDDAERIIRNARGS